MQYISKEGVDLIKKFESFRSTPYLCPAGVKTIGYGHTIRNNDYQIVNKIQAEELLLTDIKKIFFFLQKNINRLLTISQVSAIISFTFNVGNSAFQRSTLRRMINQGNHSQMPYEWRKWNKVNGRILKGLSLRREEEINLYFR